jgi:dienelactone hydrolase
MHDMDQDTNAVTQVRSREHWQQARRKAFLQKLYNAIGLTREPIDLLSFEEVQEKLRLNQNAYRGLQQVPVDQIVGSVGRYHDFTRTFLPLIESDSYRWQRVADLQAEMGLPPIELYKVGDAYFVKDGNHRVSVARQFGMHTIEAYVWEYQTPLGGLPANAKIDDLIVKAEYRTFLDRTRLDLSHPDQKIEVTEPGMYPELELQIELYRENLQRIDREERTYEDAASAWYELVYSPAVDVIRESNVLDLFPGRTEADLFVWVSRHRQELSERYGERVSLRDAVARLVETKQQHKISPVERMVQSAARSVADLVHSLALERAEPESMALPPSQDEPLGKLLAQVNAQVPSMAYNGQRGDEWREWRATLRGKVWELLGMSYQPADHVPVEVVERSLVSGVERTKIRLMAADGLQLPAYVMRPVDMAEPPPGLLIYPGHGTIRQTAGLEHSEHHSNALALAQAGYVTITVEERGFGELGQIDHLTLDTIARLIGRTWFGMTLEDGLRALDYLQSLEEVQPDRLGVTGLGLGGGLALYTAALDERIRAVVIENYLGGDIDPLSVLGHGCDFIPALRCYAELSDVARLIVPRPMLFAYPSNRSTTMRAHAFFDKMRPSYEVFRCPDRTNFVQHDEGEDFGCCGAKDWFDRWLVEEKDTSVLLWAPRE